MVLATNLGFPRIGAKRELKKALEAYWAGKSDLASLRQAAKDIRKINWEAQRDAGIDHIPSNEFTFYDQVLDMAATVGAVPARYGWSGDTVDLDTYFAMARGSDDATAMEMTKWFDTNYHYIVPEFTKDQDFKLSFDKIFDEFTEAKELGITTRPVLIGPVTFLLLGKAQGGAFEPLELLDKLLPVYGEILSKLAEAGAEWVQVDEPVLVIEQPDAVRAALKTAYAELSKAAPQINLLLTTYFDGLYDNLDAVLDLPVKGLHLDLVRAPKQLDDVLGKLPEDKILSLGLIDGRNIWRTDLVKALDVAEKAVEKLGGDRVFIAPSCSLIHVPVDLDNEKKKLDDELKGWLSFAKQKLDEIRVLATALNEGRDAVKAELDKSAELVESRRTSTRIHNPVVKERAAAVTEDMLRRGKPFKQRVAGQHAALKLPKFPTTTIGSFPQTPEIRKSRAAFKRGELSLAEYEGFLKKEIEGCVRFQEEIGIDVLVHGEAERNDMVEYFGELLDGYAFTGNGWVQSYGSRYVKPPIIFGDVARPEPMTVRWSEYAQSLTKKPMKGMLTGPITMLQWAFVRDDQPRSETAKQIALALRDEVVDLETAGIKAIQIDEPAIREGLPLRKSDWDAYLKWAVDAFRLSSSGVQDDTQIHTHMCYSEFNDIIDSIAALDADVISIETSRSHMELLDAFVNFKYPNEIGPGVYDIHSPRQVSREEMETLLKKAAGVLNADQLWVNPDCGLKTRKWDEVKIPLKNMVEAAREMRQVALAAE